MRADITTRKLGGDLMSAAFELIDGVPNYNLYVGGKWVRSSRNEAAESRNPATGELFAKVQQAGAAETEAAISAAHGAYKAWAATPISAREAIVFRAADVLAAKTKEIVEVLIQESGSIAGRPVLRSAIASTSCGPPPRRCEGRRAKRCRSRRPASLALLCASRSA
jgi:hypothetical protein